jgi:hypothetical integral membrane protein (TIGR02206 family)
MTRTVEPIGRMTPFGTEHLSMLLLTVLASIVVVLIGRRIRGTAHESTVLTATGWTLLSVTVLWTAWGMSPGQWNIDQSLPVQFSDALRFITSIALLTRARWAIAISYYWGLTLNVQSILTPDLNYYSLPILEFVAYWFLHIVVFVVPIGLVWGLGHRPTWRGYGIALAGAFVWAGVAIAVNTLTGANYAYLNHAPAGPSALDLLGPWPIYILWEAVLVAVVWALMTWPWTRSTRARASTTETATEP